MVMRIMKNTTFAIIAIAAVLTEKSGIHLNYHHPKINTQNLHPKMEQNPRFAYYFKIVNIFFIF
jgi:hypothetical protein